MLEPRERGRFGVLLLEWLCGCEEDVIWSLALLNLAEPDLPSEGRSPPPPPEDEPFMEPPFFELERDRLEGEEGW